MQTKAIRTQNSYLPPPSFGERFIQLNFEDEDDDVGIYFTIFPCEGRFELRRWPTKIARARYNDIALVISGLMDLVRNKKAPIGKNVAAVNLGKYGGDKVVPIDEIDEKQFIMMGMAIWQSKSARHFLPGEMDTFQNYKCDNYAHLVHIDVS